MDRGTWKAIERFFAKALGGERVPITGRSRGSAPDIEHKVWAIEVKAGKTLSTRLQDGMDQAIASAAAAAKEGKDKTPILCISHSRKGKAGNINWVAMRLEDFVDWHGKE